VDEPSVRAEAAADVAQGEAVRLLPRE